MNLRDLIEVRKVLLNEVPCLLVRPKKSEGELATLFHYHGWSSKKENHQFLATTVVQYGFQVILPDSNYHGDRNPLSDYNFENLKKYFGEIIIQSVLEFQGIVKEALELYDVDEKRIAVSGNSMGGFIASSIFARNSNIKALICFNGGSSWKKSAEMLEEVDKLEDQYIINHEKLSKFEPLTYKDNFYPRPILMLHGDADTSVPINIQRYFYQEVAPLYKANPDRIKLEEYHNMNHHISIKMVESAIKWLDTYL